MTALVERRPGALGRALVSGVALLWVVGGYVADFAHRALETET